MFFNPMMVVAKSPSPPKSFRIVTSSGSPKGSSCRNPNENLSVLVIHSYNLPKNVFWVEKPPFFVPTFLKIKVWGIRPAEGFHASMPQFFFSAQRLNAPKVFFDVLAFLVFQRFCCGFASLFFDGLTVF